jgi:hypothetical protein
VRPARRSVERDAVNPLACVCPEFGGAGKRGERRRLKGIVPLLTGNPPFGGQRNENAEKDGIKVCVSRKPLLSAFSWSVGGRVGDAAFDAGKTVIAPPSS